jgi:hypothetical protein
MQEVHTGIKTISKVGQLLSATKCPDLALAPEVCSAVIIHYIVIHHLVIFLNS